MSRATSAKNLIDAVGDVRGPNQLVVEESAIAQWVKSTLEPYVDKLIVCDPKRNKWIAGDDYCDDEVSAVKLAQLLRGGYIKEIHHPDDAGAMLRAQFYHYYDLNRQLTRFKNKLKDTYRRVGMKVTGHSIYEPGDHRKWLDELRGYPALMQKARHCFELIDVFARLKQEAYKAMTRSARKKVCNELLLGIPGIGPVIAAGYIAIIQTPDRFSRENKLWRYACLGNNRHVSDEVVYADGPSPTGNRVLKWLVMKHFQAAVQRKKPNRFSEQYRRLRQEGMAKKTARRHVCRSLLSVTRAVWSKGEPYREEC